MWILIHIFNIWFTHKNVVIRKCKPILLADNWLVKIYNTVIQVMGTMEAPQNLLPCMFCPNHFASDEFEDHLYLHHHLCFRCNWCTKEDYGNMPEPIYVYYGVSWLLYYILYLTMYLYNGVSHTYELTYHLLSFNFYRNWSNIKSKYITCCQNIPMSQGPAAKVQHTAKNKLLKWFFRNLFTQLSATCATENFMDNPEVL